MSGLGYRANYYETPVKVETTEDLIKYIKSLKPEYVISGTKIPKPNLNRYDVKKGDIIRNTFVYGYENYRILYIGKDLRLSIAFVYRDEKIKNINKYFVSVCNEINCGKTFREYIADTRGEKFLDHAVEFFSDGKHAGSHIIESSITIIRNNSVKYEDLDSDDMRLTWVMDGVSNFERRGDDFVVERTLSAPPTVSYKELVALIKRNHKEVFKEMRAYFEMKLDAKKETRDLPKSLFKPTTAVITKDRRLVIHYSCRIKEEEA